MSSHLFKVGSSVSLNVDGQQPRKEDRYIVEALMPPVGTNLQYRIKAEGEGFRRVVVEHQLSAVGAVREAVVDRSVGPHSGEED